MTAVAASALLAVPVSAAHAAVPAAPVAPQAVGAEGTYYPLAPQRVLDTRFGIGVPAAKVGQGGTVDLPVAGRGGLPATGVAAVVLNVTATEATGHSFVTVYPTGVTRPNASNLNFPPGWTGANSVTVPVAADGRVSLYNNAGSVHLIADVVGFYAANDSVLATHGVTGGYASTLPERMFDTRNPEQFVGAMQPFDSMDLSIGFGDAEFDATITALALNVTAVSPTAAGYLTTWSGAGTAPDTSTLNFTAGAVVPNMAIVPVSRCNQDWCDPGAPLFSVLNGSSGSTHVLVDLVGYYVNDPEFTYGMRYRPLNPSRIADSRFGQGTSGALGPQTTVTIDAPNSVATPLTGALSTNVTAVGATANTFLTVWAAGFGDLRPDMSNLNPTPGQTIPNAVLAELGPQNQFHIYNNGGSTHVVVDVNGSFEYQEPADQSAKSKATRTPTRTAVRKG